MLDLLLFLTPLVASAMCLSIDPYSYSYVSIFLSIHPSIYLSIRNTDVGPSTKVVHITSTQEITVYCVNKERYTTDAYVAYPTHVVGDEYFAMTYT